MVFRAIVLMRAVKSLFVQPLDYPDVGRACVFVCMGRASSSRLPTMVYTCVTSSDIVEEGMIACHPKIWDGRRFSYRGCRRRYAVNVHNKMLRYSSAQSSSPGREQKTMRMRLNLKQDTIAKSCSFFWAPNLPFDTRGAGAPRTWHYVV